MRDQAIHQSLIIAVMLMFSHSLSCHSSPYPGADRQPQGENLRQKESKPTEGQVKELVDKEFGGLFKVDEQNISPSYLIADFNGDGVEDIAVSVQLNREIRAGDESKPLFILEKAYGPGPSTAGERGHESTLTMQDLARYRNLAMLAVIHGSGMNGWNNSQPQRRFVVLDAWRLGKKNMSSYKGELKPTPYGDEPQIISPPRLLGKAILMMDEQNNGTAVYWDGARYRWYPVNGLPR